MKYPLGWDVQGGGWHCSDASYSAKVAHMPNYHSFYGFSGAAAQVELSLPGESPQRIQPIGGAYMLIRDQNTHGAYSKHIERARMLDAAGQELASLTEFDRPH